MGENPTYDYLIVGQGIAGSILGYTFIKSGLRTRVIDNNAALTSSKIAAGIYNPVVFRRLVKSWNADVLVNFAKDFYGHMEDFLGTKFHYNKEITRIFASKQQKEEWHQKSNDPEYAIYLQKKALKLPDVFNQYTPYGTGTVNKAGQIDTNVLISSFRQYLKENLLLTEKVFHYEKLVVHKNTVEYDDKAFNKVIFCEGHAAVNNPFFNWLPFSLTKGELLTLEIPGASLDTIISKGVFLMPMGNNRYKLGSTFNWRKPDNSPSPEGKAELLTQLAKFYDGPYEILSHEAAIRPTVKDRRPFIGLHPNYANIGLFNGLGSKGLMLAPYYAQQFCDFLTHKKKLDKEVNLLRYFSN